MRKQLPMVGAAFALGAFAAAFPSAASGNAKVFETEAVMKTYPFSDPDPVPAVDERRYPYFRYDGTTPHGEPKAWKMVVLENENIRVTMMPDIGGKVWGATDKRTGVDFIYHNHVVKFRDIAMRGPWCSGGIEFNFGIIGHAPSSATPVDWFVRTNSNGSVSFFASSAEYITRSHWQVEVRLAPGAESFETRTVWFNSSGLPQPYYHWMNAAFSLKGNPRFLFPGASYIGHEGDVHAWPRDAAGHELDVYLGNAFGGPKSYHILPGDSGTYAIWWPEKGVGAVHRSTSWEKYGRKIWLWALSREGGIWEDLLTDADGQYTELQSGRCFNQPRLGNYRTPFKHPVFYPGSTESFTESWGVLRGTNEFARCVDVPAKRPETAPADFAWKSAWGRCVRGEQYLRERCDAKAEECFRDALKLDAHLSPALFGLASIELRRGEYAACHELCRRALAIDAYDSGANYLDGFAFFAEGDLLSARDRLGLAAFDPRYRSAAYALIARSYLREGNMGEANNAAGLSLSANDANLDALLVRLIAARGTSRAERMAKELLERYPLFHAARYELEGEGFRRYVRNELPHETYMELGSWYEESGLCDDAQKLFSYAGADCPMARIRAAHLSREVLALQKIAALPAAKVFPFRRESLPALRWAAKAHGGWKFKYYLAVALASFHLDSEADALFAACGDKPDESVFYMVRSARRTGKERLADLERAKSLGDSWRVGRALCRYYADMKDYPGMLEAAKGYVARYPKKNSIQIAYADALVKNRLFKEAIEYLEGVTILPSEYSDNATGIWHEAQRSLGLELTYPENLGSGKPFPEEKSAQSLEEGFRSPPSDAKPQTWYHLMNGNVTKAGITRDFEEIAKAGLGGVQIFDVGCDIPPGDLDFGTPEWFDMLRHAHNEANRLGLVLGIHNCSGWSSSGGPWVKPSDAMKITMHTETAVKGPSRFSGVLPRTKKDNGFYADIAVLAYPTPRVGATLSKAAEKTGRTRKIRDGSFSRDTKELPADQTIAKDAIIDLTDKMAKDGTLSWDVPAGEWTILRLGYICNGRKNRLPSLMGEGLEVDKFSAEALDRHFDAYMGRLCRELGIRAGDARTTGLCNIHVDSWEVGCQNWTHGLERIFEERTGYSIVPYLPVLAGRVVGSVEESERFCEDFRRLLADLLAERYAGRLAERCHEYGLAFSCEPYGGSNADDFQYGENVDIPMSCFWVDGTCGPGKFPCMDNSHYAASLAHVWGRRYVADEAFTSGPPKGGRWLATPFSIKWQNDRAFAGGCNLIVYHRFTHQPWANDRYLPGMTMGRWGMHLDRTQTWWPLAGGWFRYQARCQWMLQEGRFVADALFWGGEAAPKHGWPKTTLPKGYDFDVCATKAVELLKVKDGKIVVPGGVEYEMLVLPDTDTMSERMLRRVGELAAQGARVVAPRRPTRAPGMVGIGRDGAGYRAAVDSAWSKGVMECPPHEALKRLGVAPDFESGMKDVAWIHRRSETADWYFVACGSATNVSFEASFRIAGKVPEIWDAESGEIADAAEWRIDGGRTIVRLDFPPSGSAFVVFRKQGNGERVTGNTVNPVNPVQKTVALAGPWKVSFPVDWYTGGTNVKSFAWAELKDWTTDADPDVKYFSGTATYKCKVESVKCKVNEDRCIILDLGDVKDFAEVTVNGKKYPPLWRPPFKVDITDAANSPHLDLEIKVTNRWPNRLIGDDILYPDDCEWKLRWHQWQKLNEPGIKEIPQWVKEGKLSPTGRHTFTTWKHWTKKDKLLHSGLLGPVSIQMTLHNK